jgi:hypothetical protein
MPIHLVLLVGMKLQPPLVYSEIVATSVDIKVDAEESTLDEHGTDLG